MSQSPARFTSLGRSGLTVSRACLGTMNFGLSEQAPCDEAEGIRIVHAFLDAGNNFVDTANTYMNGDTERIVGKAIAGRRDEVVLATKGRSVQGPGPNEGGSSRVHLTRALEDSLRRLDTDHVDLYQMHSWDPQTPIEETMATLDGFVRSGKVRYLGCSNYTGSQIVESQWAAERVGGTPFVSMQPRYALISREIELDVLPACRRHGLGVIAYSPLGGGMLTGKYRREEAPPPDTRYGRVPGAGRVLRPALARRAEILQQRVRSDHAFDIVDEVVAVSAELDTTPTAVSLAWLLAQPGLTSVIIGPRTVEQLDQNLTCLDLELPDDARRRLDDVSAPESWQELVTSQTSTRPETPGWTTSGAVWRG